MIQIISSNFLKKSKKTKGPASPNLLLQSCFNSTVHPWRRYGLCCRL